jgi:hypothetical protein
MDNRGERQHDARDRPSGSVIYKSESKGRSRGSSLSLFYQNLHRKAVVDPLALFALLVAGVPLAASAWWWFTPTNLDIKPMENITVYLEDYPLPGEVREDIIRVTALFNFDNKHKTKRATVDSVSSQLIVGDFLSEFIGSQFIHSYEDPEESDSLKITYLATAGRFSVPADQIVAKEVFFAPKPGTTDDPLAFAITKDEFYSSIQDGNVPCIRFVIKTDRGYNTWGYKPDNIYSLPIYLERKGWVVSKWSPVSKCVRQGSF